MRYILDSKQGFLPEFSFYEEKSIVPHFPYFHDCPQFDYGTKNKQKRKINFFCLRNIKGDV